MVVADNPPGRLRPDLHTPRPATIGAGRIGSYRAAFVARHIPGVTAATVTPAAVTRFAVTGHDARRAPSFALAAIRGVETDRPVTIAEVTA
ncbi:hypothetical protein [Streptomyces sp. NPDC002172]